MNDLSPTPLVSIITPSFNQGQFIEGTIKSVAAQTYQHTEHIIIDGGSSDSTIDVLKRTEPPYGFRWVSESDNGMYHAINKGLRMATGDIVAYLNSDDRYFPWSVEMAVSSLASDPEASFVYGDLWNLDVESGKGALLIHPKFTLRRLAATGFIAQPTVFWRRSAMEKIGEFDDNLKFVGDMDYWLRLMTVGNAKKINEALAIELNHEATKRSTAQADLNAELVRVRSSHAPTRSTGMWSQWHRAAVFIDRRAQYVRFVASYMRQGSGKPWNRFIEWSEASLRWRKAMLAMLPLGGQSHVRDMIKPAASQALDPGKTKLPPD